MQPRITVDSLVEATLLPDRLTLDLTAVYTIEKAGVFRLELDVPAGYDVRKVQRGERRPGADARCRSIPIISKARRRRGWW